MKNTLGSFLLTATLFGTAGGCVVEARGRVVAPPPPVVAVNAEVEVEEEPPPPRTIVLETRPGFIIVEGRWARRGGRWDWVPEHYERERVGYVWFPGRWERRGKRHVYIEGEWRASARGGTVVRDHRTEPPPAAPPAAPPDPVVRDHRH